MEGRICLKIESSRPGQTSISPKTPGFSLPKSRLTVVVLRRSRCSRIRLTNTIGSASSGTFGAKFGDRTPRASWKCWRPPCLRSTTYNLLVFLAGSREHESSST